VELVAGEARLEPGRALDLGCGAGRNALYLARHGWNVTGIDMIGRAVDKARSRAVDDAAKARFLQGDVTKLGDLDLGDGYNLIVNSGCYYGLSDGQRDAYAAGVTTVAAPEALLLMAGFSKIPGIVAGISEQDLCRRFAPGQSATSACGTPSAGSFSPSEGIAESGGDPNRRAEIGVASLSRANQGHDDLVEDFVDRLVWDRRAVQQVVVADKGGCE
jgi:SAM-dependent methyltransferase